MRGPEATQHRVEGASFAVTSDALQKALWTWQGLLESLPAAVFACNRDGRLALWNRRASELWGRPPRDGETWEAYCAAFKITLGNGDPVTEMPIYEALRTGAPVHGREFVMKAADGRRVTLLANVDPLFDAEGAVIGCVACHQDIGDLKRAQQTLGEREQWHRELLDALPAAIYTTDGAGRITFFNKAAEELAGRTPTLGSDEWCVTWRLFWPDGRPMRHDECPMAIALRENRPIRGAEAVAERPDGRRVPFIPYPTPLRDAAGEIVGAVNMLVDISAHKESEQERQRLVAELRQLNETLEQRVEERTHALLAATEERRAVEAQLHQLQKTEALGQLTGGIAHDFNNLLTVVLGNLDLIRTKTGDEAVRRHADAGARAAQRGASLTQQLLAFSRKQRLDPKPTNINELVTGMGELLLQTLGGTVRIELGLGKNLWPGLIDRNQTESAILNLAINARDAMADGGTVTIETENLRVGEADPPAGLAAGDYVMIAVSDTGTGMSDEVKEQAFDPFFTTKEVGKGSGLSLSQVYGVARQSGGTVTLDSAPGKGTTVRLYLPRAQGAASEPPERERARRTKIDSRGGCRILVVDDDDDVREVMTLSLERQGHRVIETRSAGDALALLERQPFDLVILDFAMPDMNGAEAGRLVHERCPGVPLLYVTGYSRPADFAEDIAEAQILRKPFLAADLEAKVRTLLAGAAEMPSNVVRFRASGD